MNFKSALAHIVTPASVKEEREAAANAATIQRNFEAAENIQKYNVWFAMPQSKELIGELTNAYNYYIQRAKDLAAEGVKDTSALLIQATTIEKVIKYVRTRESITDPNRNSNGK